MIDVLCTLDKLTLDCQLNYAAFSPTSILNFRKLYALLCLSLVAWTLCLPFVKENFDMLLPTLCRIVICASVTKNRRLIATTQKNHPWTTKSLVIIGLSQISRSFQKSSKKLLQYVFGTTWNPTNLMNRLQAIS